MDDSTWVLIIFVGLIFLLIGGAYWFASWRYKQLKKME